MMKNAEYNANTPLGSLEPVVLYFRRPGTTPIGFHVTELEYAKLNGGRGKLYGRTPWGPWCRLSVYDFRVVGYYIVRDRAELEKIREEMET